MIKRDAVVIGRFVFVRIHGNWVRVLRLTNKQNAKVLGGK